MSDTEYVARLRREHPDHPVFRFPYRFFRLFNPWKAQARRDWRDRVRIQDDRRTFLREVGSNNNTVSGGSGELLSVGFKPPAPEGWKEHPFYRGQYVPDRRTKAGKALSQRMAQLTLPRPSVIASLLGEITLKWGNGVPLSYGMMDLFTFQVALPEGASIVCPALECLRNRMYLMVPDATRLHPAWRWEPPAGMKEISFEKFARAVIRHKERNA